MIGLKEGKKGILKLLPDFPQKDFKNVQIFLHQQSPQKSPYNSFTPDANTALVDGDCLSK